MYEISRFHDFTTEEGAKGHTARGKMGTGRRAGAPVLRCLAGIHSMAPSGACPPAPAARQES